MTRSKAEKWLAEGTVVNGTLAFHKSPTCPDCQRDRKLCSNGVCGYCNRTAGLKECKGCKLMLEWFEGRYCYDCIDKRNPGLYDQIRALAKGDLKGFGRRHIAIATGVKYHIVYYVLGPKPGKALANPELWRNLLRYAYKGRRFEVVIEDKKILEKLAEDLGISPERIKPMKLKGKKAYWRLVFGSKKLEKELGC